jgi:hypothetical protein
VIKYELHVTKYWVESHISDFSGFQYRQNLLSLVLSSAFDGDEASDERQLEARTLLEQEMELVNGLLNLYTDQESLFCQRRFILKSWSTRYPQEKERLQEEEILFIEKNLSRGYIRGPSSVWNGWQFELVRRHTKWLRNALKWELDPEK